MLNFILSTFKLSTKKELLGESQSEPNKAVSVARVKEEIAISRAAILGHVAIASITDNAARTRGWAGGVGLRRGRVCAVPISTPFIYIAVHVVQSIGIGAVAVYCLRLVWICGACV